MKLVTVDFKDNRSDIVKAAESYIRRGWHVVPCNGKVPVLKNWPSENISLLDLESYFSRRENVGVRLDRLTDIDLDSAEAIALAPYLLPPTPTVFGHGTTKGASHYIYDCRGLKALKYTYNKQTLLEIRHGDQCQTVFPPSRHAETGERIEWVNPLTPAIKPASISGDELKAHCNLLAAACILLKHWHEGQRHDLSVAVHGVMLRGGMSQAEIEHVLTAVCTAAGDDASRLQAVYESARLKRGAPVPGIPSLASILGEEGKDKFLDWMNLDPGKNVIEELNQQYAYAILGGKGRVLRFDERGRFKDHSTVEAIKELLSSDTILINRKPVNKVKYWINHKNCRRYPDGITFDPSGKEYENAFNLWRGFAVEPCDGDIDKYLQHVYEIICDNNNAKYEWLCAWLANMVQCPSEKPGTALVLQGGEGAGKNIFTAPWGAIYGVHCVELHHVNQLTGHFNGLLKDKMLVVADEVIWGGNRKEGNVLRSLITAERLNIELKGMEAFSVPAYFRLIMITNNQWAVPAAGDSRRYFVLKVNPKRTGDMAYFNRLARVPAGAILKYFLQYAIRDDINLRQAPWTPELQIQRELSAEPIVAWWLARLQEGQILHGVPWDEPVECRKVIAAYSNSDRYSRSTETEFGIGLKRLVHGLKKTRKVLVPRGEQKTAYQFPPLAKCRRDYERMFANGNRLEWP